MNLMMIIFYEVNMPTVLNHRSNYNVFCLLQNENYRHMIYFASKHLTNTIIIVMVAPNIYS